MKIILFIGHHKAGSTTLQAYLAQNWLKLWREKRILYPMVEFEGLAHVLKVAVDGGDMHGDLPINVREPHNTLAFKMIAEADGFKFPGFLPRPPRVNQMVRGLHHQVAYFEPETLIFCSEVLSNFGIMPGNLIQKLKDIFPDADYEIYLTLRRPDQYLAAWHGQRFRFGYKWGRFQGEVAQKYAKSFHFDYQKLLQPWREKIPEAVFHIRNYRAVLAAGGSCEDFTQQVGADFPSDMVAVPRANESLPYAFYEIARQANRTFERPLASAMVHFLGETPAGRDVPANSEVEIFGQESRDFLADAFEPIHAYLGEVTGQAPFFDDIAEMRRAHPIPEMEAYRTALDRLIALPAKDRPVAPLWAFLQDLARR